jgi:predicted transcriptional regulator
MATKLTRNQSKAHIAIRVRAQVRARQAKDLSAKGLSIEEAATALGMTLGGVRSMLFREVGSSCWPIQQGGA